MPAAAGYSGTPLVKKLGIRPGMRAAFVAAPKDYDVTLGALPEDVKVLTRPGKDMDFVQVFAVEQAKLARGFDRWAASLARDGMLWVSWPKKAAEANTDLDGNKVRSIGLEAGLVDVKVCAVDQTWSGLKFVRRVKDR